MAARGSVEALEPRRLLSTSNAIDEIDFGNPTSEAIHQFDLGFSSVPLQGVGQYGLTYREPFGSGSTSTTSSQALTFTLNVDPKLQNYLTVKLWGSDIDGGQMAFINAPNVPTMDYSGGTAEYPNQFFYETAPIPIAMTQGKTSAQLTLMFYSIYDAYAAQTQTYLPAGQMTRPVYSAYSTTAPQFVPPTSALVGSMPSTTGQATYSALTLSQAVSILQANRQNIFGSGGYLSTIIGEQALTLSSTASGPNSTYTWTAPTGAPEEVTGLDLFTNLASWMTANPSATAAQWDNQIAGTQAGPGYTPFPDELLSVLAAAYETAPFTDASGTVVSGLDDYHDPSLIARIVAAIDGSSYEQDSDGGFIQQGASAAANSAWTGLTSTPRTLGAYAGVTSRESTVHGGGDLQGVDTYALGWTIIELLNDSTAAPILKNYLTQSYDANLTDAGSNAGLATSVKRVTAWEEMLYNAINFYESHTGGVESQNSFQMTALYADQVALEKLQALYPNSAYPALTPDTGLNYVEQLMGFAPDTFRGILTGTAAVNYGETNDGMGEAHGVLSSGYDGRYGEMLPWLDPRIAYLVQLDPGLTSAADKTMITQIVARAQATINSYDEFISPQQNYNGTTDTFTLAQEDFITYRDPYNTNADAGSFHLNSQYIASSPTAGINDAEALRSAYLETQYAITPGYNSSSYNSSLNYLKDLGFYESTIRSLVGVNPSTLTALPGEPGQANSAFVDPQSGAAAVYYNGERLYINADYRNYETNGSSFTNMGPSFIARIDDTLNSVEYAAQVMMPHDSTTVQSDGNLSSATLQQEWVVRYGNWLVVGNPSSSAVTVTLPPGVGDAENLTTGTYYTLGSSLSVAAGGSAVIRLNVATAVGVVGPGSDIGAVGVAGSDAYSSGVYTVTGSGAGIGGTLDAFHFVPTSVSGNGNIIAQITSQTSATSLSQVGVMIRDGSGASADFAEVVRTSGNGVMFEWRSAAGASAAWITVPNPLTNVWVKLSRTGNSVSGYYSTDGVHWTQIGASQTLSFAASPSSALFGLAVTSAKNSVTSTAVFSNVTVGAAPTIVNAATASATVTTGTTANLSVLGSDSNDTYTWMTTGTSPDSVSYSVNATTAAQNTTATFSVAGTYTLQALITNASGLTTLSNAVIVTVTQKMAGVTVATQSSGTGTEVLLGTSLPLIATAIDQFGEPMETAQVYSWSLLSGVGSVTSLGVYTAPASGSGSATIAASVGGFTGTIALTVPASVGIFAANQDIGSPTPAGSSSFNNTTSTYTLSGSGSDIWGNTDQLQYIYEPFTGNGTVTAEVTSQTDSNVWAKAGVMFRNTLLATSANAMIAVTPGEGITFQERTSDRNSTTNQVEASFTVPYWVRLTRNGTVFTSYYSANGTTWTELGTTDTIAMNNTIYVGLFVCSHDAGTLSTAGFTNVSIAPLTRTFAANEDIGDPNPSGSYSETSGSVTLTAGGDDIWSASDQFQYGYNEIAGNGSITVEVDSVTDTNVWTKAGIMVRNTLAANSANASLFVTPGEGIDFQWRYTAGGGPYQTVVTGLTAPYYLRLTDTSNSFAAYYSSNGTAWTQVGSAETVAMNTDAFAGVALTSHDSGTLATAAFNNITSTFASAAIAAPNLSHAATAATNPVAGTTVALSAAATDTIEGSSNLTYTWLPLGEPPAPMTFSVNGTNSAATTTVTFTGAGAYLFQLTIQDPNGFQTASTVSVTVNQAFTSISLSPATSTSPTVGPGGSISFSAVALDQFGNTMSASTPTWTVSGGGTISTAGLYTAPAASATATAKATIGSVSGSTNISVVNQSPLIATSATPTVSVSPVMVNTPLALSVAAVDDGGGANLTYSWAATTLPNGASAPTFSGNANGSNAASSLNATFSSAGSYVLTVNITDASSTTTTATVPVTVVAPPAVQSIMINAGAAQRSMVTSATVTFNHAVTLAAGAISIGLHTSSTNGSTAGTLPTLSWSSPDGGTTWNVTFSGNGVVAGSIANGMYDLTVNAADVVDANALSPTASTTASFYRLFGDSNGDGTVDSIDALAFRRALGSSTGSAAYVAYFDDDGNGTIDSIDALRFRQDLGLSYSL